MSPLHTLILAAVLGQAAAVPPVPFEGTRFQEHVDFLAGDELRGRCPGTEGSQKAAEHIIGQYRLRGLEPLGDNGSSVQEFPWKGKTGRNLVGLFRGEGDLAGQAIVVSAHYDHLGADPKLEESGEDGIYNGADDNASGVAAMLLIAEALGAGARSVSPRRSVIFIAFDCEERGLVGSRYYGQHPRWPLNETVAVINLDMVGRLRDGQVYAGDAESSPVLTEKLEKLAAAHRLSVDTRLSGIGSDHRVFLSNRIAAFNLTTGTHADRHGVDDEAEKINSAGGAQVAWLAHRLLLDLASSAEPIAFKPLDSRFDIGVLVRIAAGLGIVPSLGGTDAGHMQILLVLPGSAAAQAGIESGDQITALNGHPFDRPEQIHALWPALDLSQGLHFSLLRGDEQVEATIPAEVIENLIEKASANRGGER
jgi:hypothetical protein